MYANLLALPTFKSGQMIKVAETEHVKTLFHRELSKIIDYNLQTRNFVTNQHPFVKLVSLITSMYKEDIDEFMDLIYAEQIGIEKLFGLVSSANPVMSVHKKSLYNEKCQDVYISTREYFPLKDGHSNIIPVRVISHPFTDLSMGIANGRYFSQAKEVGLCSYLFDVGKFAFLVHAWLSGIMKRALHPNPDNMAQFVYMVILPRMLSSHINICMFNRLRAAYVGGGVSKHYTVYPVNTTDLTGKVDSVIKQYVKLLDQSKLTYDGIVASLPSLTQESMFDVLHIPDMRINSSNAWALLIARLDLYIFVFRIAVQNERNAATLSELRNLLKLALKTVDSGIDLPRILPYDALNKLNELRIFIED